MCWISPWLCWSGVKKRDSYGYESRHYKLFVPCSTSKSCLTLCGSTDWLLHARLLCPSLYPRACSNSCPLSWWCHPTILSSAFFSSCHQYLPASGCFHESTASGDQSAGASTSASVLPVNMKSWFPLGLTGLILLSRGLSRVLASTTVQRHQFFSAKPSLWSKSHIHAWLLERP